MKKCLTLLAATVLTGMTFASFAAQPYTSTAPECSFLRAVHFIFGSICNQCVGILNPM
ncbi:MAG: hypothetical protein E6928_14130 [Citrobacter freundii]|nr:hypothetical protein [Citrobacter freundii]